MDHHFDESQLFEVSSNNTDILEGGKAGLAVYFICQAKCDDDVKVLNEAGCILQSMYERKLKNGCYQHFKRRRMQYFLPVFLRGSTGIGYAMLLYAERSNDPRPIFSHSQKLLDILLGVKTKLPVFNRKQAVYVLYVWKDYFFAMYFLISRATATTMTRP